MKIIINEERLEFQLEKERNLGDILKSLEGWILENGNVIQRLYVNNRIVPVDYGSGEFKKDVSKIREIKIITSTHFELALDTIETVGEYIIDLLTRCNEPLLTIEENDSVLEGLQLIYEGILDSLRVFRLKNFLILNEYAGSLKDVLLEIKSFIGVYKRRYIDSEGSTRLKSLLRDLVKLIPKALAWIYATNPSLFKDSEREEKSRFLTIVTQDLSTLSRSSFQKFELIGKNLQIGNDAVAMNDLYFITELLDQMIVIIRLLQYEYKVDVQSLEVSQKTVHEIFHEISQRLKQVEEAFKDGDMISIGDIIEYELRPLFADLTQMFAKINEFI